MLSHCVLEEYTPYHGLWTKDTLLIPGSTPAGDWDRAVALYFTADDILYSSRFTSVVVNTHITSI